MFKNKKPNKYFKLLISLIKNIINGSENCIYFFVWEGVGVVYKPAATCWVSIELHKRGNQMLLYKNQMFRNQNSNEYLT